MISLSDVIVFILFGKQKSAKKIITENILQEHSEIIQRELSVLGIKCIHQWKKQHRQILPQIDTFEKYILAYGHCLSENSHLHRSAILLDQGALLKFWCPLEFKSMCRSV